jgi:hypothetical protein
MRNFAIAQTAQRSLRKTELDPDSTQVVDTSPTTAGDSPEIPS